MQISTPYICLPFLILTACQSANTTPETDITSPLITAAEVGDISTLNQLLKENPQIDARDACEWTPLMKAALNGHLEVARQLLTAGATLNLTDKGGYSAMMLAASNNHSEMVELLLSKGANVDKIENTAGWSALIWAAKQGHLETVSILLEHHANPNIIDFQGKRAIDWANAGNFKTVVSILEGATS